MYTGSGDVKQKRRARRPEGEEWSEAVIRNLRQQVKYALRFFVVETALHQNPKQLSLSPPSRTAASASSQAGQSNHAKKIINRRGHNAVAVPFSGGALHCRYATPSHPHALRACSSFESLRASRMSLRGITKTHTTPTPIPAAQLANAQKRAGGVREAR